MRFGESRWEFKVGIFVFIGIVILVVFILLIGNFRLWTAGYKINFIFNFVNGLKEGAPIRLSGVDIGEVKKIEFIFSPEENKTKVKITGWVKKEVKIPSDSNAWINTLGLLGEKYLEIIPGKDYINTLDEDKILIGNDPVAMHEVGTIAKNIADNVRQILEKIKSKDGTLGMLLYDDSIYKRLERVSEDLEAFVKDIKASPWKLLWRPKEKTKKK